MTAATTSENKKNGFFSVRFKSKISEDMKLFITNIVFQLLCLPVFAGILIWDIHLDNNMIDDRIDSVPFVIMAAIAFILSLGMGFVIPMVNFRYLYKKSLVDMNYSLPLNNRQRFFADYFSGLIIYAAPFLLGGIVALIELLIGSCCIEMDFMMKYIPDMIRLFFIVLIGMILLYTISVFAITFAGSTFEALFSIAAVNVMIPLFIYLTWGNIVEAARFGLTEKSFTQNYTFFTTSSIGVFGFIISYMDRQFVMTPLDVLEKATTPASEDNMYLNFIFRTFLVVAVMVFITFLLYKRRKAEDVSKPYVYKAFYYIIMSAVIYSIVSIMKMTYIDSGMIAALIISGVIWFVMEVIRRRGFKRFWTALISFAAASAAVIAIIKVIDLTDGLGRAKYVPSASSVSDVEIEIWGYDLMKHSSTLHGEKVIDDALKLNKEMIARHFDPDKYSYELSDFGLNMSDDAYNKRNRMSYDIDAQEIRLTFYTNGGSAIVRQYKVPSEMLTDICCDIYTDKEYAEIETKEIYYNSLRKDGGVYVGGKYINDIAADYCEFTCTDKLGVASKIEVSVEEGKELTEAICRDYTAMTADEFKNAEYYCYINDMIINSACHDTVSFLKDHDISCKLTGKELIAELDTYSSPITVSAAPEYVFPLMYFKDYNYPDDYSLGYSDEYDSYTNECIKLDSIFNLRLYRGRSYNHYGQKKHFEFSDHYAVERLLEAATPIVTGEKVLAEVQIGSMTLFITDRTGSELMIEKAKDSIKLVDNITGEEFEPDLYYEQAYSK